MKEIYGGQIAKIVKSRCEPYRDYFLDKKVSLISFAPPSNLESPVKKAFFKAATISTEQKAKTFKFLGCSVDCPYLSSLTTPGEFESLLHKTINTPNLIGIIVQNPMPRKLKSKLKIIPSTLDLDGVRKNHPRFKASATSEAIARLVKFFATEKDLVVVVGGKGFVGEGAIKLLSESKINCLSLDYGDELTQTLKGDLVVSATGVPELLDERHLKEEHKLVVDSGFIPLEDAILGDVKRSAYQIPQNLTPVPGGVGPLQMAVLLERIMSNAGFSLQNWDFAQALLEL